MDAWSADARRAHTRPGGGARSSRPRRRRSPSRMASPGCFAANSRIGVATGSGWELRVRPKLAVPEAVLPARLCRRSRRVEGRVGRLRRSSQTSSTQSRAASPGTRSRALERGAPPRLRSTRRAADGDPRSRSIRRPDRAQRRTCRSRSRSRTTTTSRTSSRTGCSRRRRSRCCGCRGSPALARKRLLKLRGAPRRRLARRPSA